MTNKLTHQSVSIEELGQGVVPEMFGDALQKVLSNIKDPNTKAESARAITLKISFKPGKTRENASYTVSCEAKLAPQAPYENIVHIGGNEATGYVAVETDLNQEKLNFDGKNIKDIKGKDK